MSLFTILEILAIVGTGLTAGIFFAFSTFVMKALARIPAEHGIAAMNSINVTVINPWFFTVFFGTPMICGILAVMALPRWSEPDAAIILAACLVHIVGSLAVTMAFNVPLNKALAAVTSAGGEGGALWRRYLSDWTFWNTVRTAAPLSAMILLLIAMAVQKGAAT
ncbi:MAG: DUF1772 domain-containing protein [Parvibaculaceae bacterium]